jgi:hypothetical protein
MTLFRTGVTVLIPKIENASDPADFRPITMGPVVARVYHRLLAARLERQLPISERQKAFRKGDGLAQNAYLIQSIIKDHTTSRSALNITFIDIKKAFDSVSQESIILAAQRMGVPPRLLDYLRDLYKDNTTRLRFGSALTDTIECRQGVRQGDPLSPILFNCVMDWALSNLDTDIGAKLGWTTVSYLAFADDIVLFSASDAGMQSQLNTLSAAFSSMGLSINEKKSASLRIQIDGKAKKWFINAKPYLTVEGRTIPAMSIVDTYKYLGTGITAEGPKTNIKAKLVEGLERLTKAPLKPQQRMSLLRDFLLPSMYHQMIFAGSSGQYCKSMDLEVRKKVRQWLGLPHDTPYAFFGCDVNEGGLGIPVLQTQIPRMRRERVESLLKSNDAAVQAMYWESPAFIAIRERSLKPVVCRGQTCISKKDIDRTMKNDLHTSCDGRGLSQHSQTKVHNWVRSGTKLQSGREYRHAIQIRSGTLTTKLRSSRGRSGASPWCDSCGPEVFGSLGHILQVCDRTHDARVKRHDAIVDRIATVSEKKGLSVIKERVISTPDGPRRPDLIVYDRNRAVVIDATIVADNARLSESHQQKVDYYNNAAIRSQVAVLTSVPEAAVEFSSATFNWRGALARESSDTLRSLKIGAREQEILSVKVVEGGYMMYNVFNRNTRRRPTRR